ncbi:hypothetical protein CC80DRAFT_502203 [Byssothecium circinans]|uniref:Uncharacterized protein n=1 Tax=Byssothecium circinans TaxID=147558 RepID=A0A6A5U2J9_9PLEO|nr:hypothetical protein CC80DRAFT_502203 [Byssothecium circinans]
MALVPVKSQQFSNASPDDSSNHTKLDALAPSLGRRPSTGDTGDHHPLASHLEGLNITPSGTFKTIASTSSYTSVPGRTEARVAEKSSKGKEKTMEERSKPGPTRTDRRARISATPCNRPSPTKTPDLFMRSPALSSNTCRQSNNAPHETRNQNPIRNTGNAEATSLLNRDFVTYPQRPQPPPTLFEHSTS